MQQIGPDSLKRPLPLLHSSVPFDESGKNMPICAYVQGGLFAGCGQMTPKGRTET